MYMIKKRQMVVEAREEGLTAAEQFYALAASLPHQQGGRASNRYHIKICDRTPIRALSEDFFDYPWAI